MRLDNIEIQSLKDLVIAFIKQYKYNMNIASDRSSQFLLVKKEIKRLCVSMLNNWEIWPAKYMSHFWIKRWSPYLLIPQSTLLRACNRQLSLTIYRCYGDGWTYWIRDKEWKDLHPLRRKVLEVKRKMLIMLKVNIREKRIISKISIVKPLHPK